LLINEKSFGAKNAFKKKEGVSRKWLSYVRPLTSGYYTHHFIIERGKFIEEYNDCLCLQSFRRWAYISLKNCSPMI